MTRLLRLASAASIVLSGCVDRVVWATPGGPETDSAGTTGTTGTTASDPPVDTTHVTTSGTTSELAGVTSTSTTGVDFIVTPDGGTYPYECDLYAQDCDDGEKCVTYAEDGGSSWNATKCVPITGHKQPGQPCTVEGSGVSGIDDCERAGMCWDVDVMGMGTCIAFCGGTPDAPICPDGSYCSFGREFDLCMKNCDPLLQDCAGEDLCIPNGDGFLCVLDASGDLGKANDPCEFANSCDKGLVCLNTTAASSACMPGSQGCCQPFCEFMEGKIGACPNPDQHCVQWFDPDMWIPPGLENVGVCAIPP